jgi:predicted nucleotidyltransferase
MTRVHLDVAVDLHSDPIHGVLDDRRGTTIDFTGWLELMSAFDTARATLSSLDGQGQETQGRPR